MFRIKRQVEHPKGPYIITIVSFIYEIVADNDSHKHLRHLDFLDWTVAFHPFAWAVHCKVGRDTIVYFISYKTI